ncbi:Uncharacterised protein [Mycobacteroides abscessus subsp. abscessus]|nr:Uncharacterised protein [Mycobacteroides abscessus subsp. abscessus]
MVARLASSCTMVSELSLKRLSMALRVFGVRSMRVR